MPTPIALQLYSVREALAQEFAGVIRQVAEIGYDGVETAGFPGTTPEAAARLFQDLGLRVCSAHTPLPLGDRQGEVLDMMAALGCQRMICAYLSPDEYRSLEQIRHNCDMLNEANAVAVANGLSFGLHNHWWEFEPVEGQYPYHLWLEHLDPAVFFEIDTYWVQTAGLDPAAVLKEFGERAPLLHIKDGPAVKEEPMTAVGEGVMDFPGILRAAGNHPEWLIVELDRCATDMLEAVTKSYRALAELAQ
jgi:sugar phosphate isomerase/epimerase